MFKRFSLATEGYTLYNIVNVKSPIYFPLKRYYPKDGVTKKLNAKWIPKKRKRG